MTYTNACLYFTNPLGRTLHIGEKQYKVVDGPSLLFPDGTSHSLSADTVISLHDGTEIFLLPNAPNGLPRIGVRCPRDVSAVIHPSGDVL